MERHAQQTAQPGHPPQAVILNMAFGAMLPQALRIAAILDIADHLSNGPADIKELAQQTGTHERNLYRVLRCLASTGVFAEGPAGVFSNTPTSEVLRSDAPGSLRDPVIFAAEPWHYAVWGDMLHSVKTGETAFLKTFGDEIFSWFADRPDDQDLFNRAMTGMSMLAAPAVVEAYDFSGIQVLADIAGGVGYLLSQILKANPALKGILFDLEHVIAEAPEMLESQGVADRVETVSGDFFKEVPQADAYLMKHIIHDWDDEKATAIMTNINRAMVGNGKLLLVEMVVPEGNEPHFSKMLDLEMMTLPGGFERTEKEYSDLLEASGFRLNQIFPTKSPFSVLEAFKK